MLLVLGEVLSADVLDLFEFLIILFVDVAVVGINLFSCSYNIIFKFINLFSLLGGKLLLSLWYLLFQIHSSLVKFINADIVLLLLSFFKFIDFLWKLISKFVCVILCIYQILLDIFLIPLKPVTCINPESFEKF